MLIISTPVHYYLSSKCFFLFRLVYFLKWISNSNHWPLFIFLWYHLISLCYMSDHYVWFNVACTHMFTDDTTYTMVYCISLCQMQWLTHTHTHISYWKHYFNHVVCHITMTDLMMNVHTCFTDDTTYIMLYLRSICHDECTHMFYW